MRTFVSSAALEKVSADLLALVCDEDMLAPDSALDVLDAALGGALRAAIRDERFRANPGQQLALHTLGKLPAARLLLVGVGARAGVDAAALRSAAGRAARAAHLWGAKRLALSLPPLLNARVPDGGRALELLVCGVHLGGYRFDKYLAEDKRAPRSLTDVEIILDTSPLGTPPIDAAAVISRGERLAAAVARARDWVNEPAGHLTPARLAEAAVDLASQSGQNGQNWIEAKVLGPEECKRMGMGLYLAVAQGSEEEPRFIHLAWRPAGAKKRVVLVGKGVTFDSGGLSLKPNDAMLDMKTDMAGAAAVLAAIGVVASEQLAVEVHALAACTENMPSGRSYKLGDVLRSKAGKTVEINNTDAEGRLTLADAITYGRELSPDQVFDFATLTGACIVALGPHTAGVMSNNDDLASAWLDAARAVGEEMWRLPLPERLREQLKSDVADMKNTGERWGGALTAGLFLREFVGDVPWVHVDLAGPSTSDKDAGDSSKGGTGFAVLTIVEHLRRLAAA